MKYAEYQVWFHAFNNAITAFANGDNLSANDVIIIAEAVANKALEKFKDVKMPESPVGLEGIDLQGLVNQVAQKAVGKK